MKRLAFLALVLLSALSLKAQEDSTEANMHLYVQAGGAMAYTPFSNLNEFSTSKPACGRLIPVPCWVLALEVTD